MMDSDAETGPVYKFSHKKNLFIEKGRPLHFYVRNCAAKKKWVEALQYGGAVIVVRSTAQSKFISAYNDRTAGDEDVCGSWIEDCIAGNKLIDSEPYLMKNLQGASRPGQKREEEESESETTTMAITAETRRRPGRPPKSPRAPAEDEHEDTPESTEEEKSEPKKRGRPPKKAVAAAAANAKTGSTGKPRGRPRKNPPAAPAAVQKASGSKGRATRGRTVSGDSANFEPSSPVESSDEENEEEEDAEAEATPSRRSQRTTAGKAGAAAAAVSAASAEKGGHSLRSRSTPESSAKKRPAPEEDEEDDSGDDDDEDEEEEEKRPTPRNKKQAAPAKTTPQKAAASSSASPAKPQQGIATKPNKGGRPDKRTRQFWTEEDDKKMVRFWEKNHNNPRLPKFVLHGHDWYPHMAELFPGRSAESVRERFRKYVVPDYLGHVQFERIRRSGYKTVEMEPYHQTPKKKKVEAEESRLVVRQRGGDDDLDSDEEEVAHSSRGAQKASGSTPRGGRAKASTRAEEDGAGATGAQKVMAMVNELVEETGAKRDTVFKLLWGTSLDMAAARHFLEHNKFVDSKIYFTTAEDDILLSKDDKGISDIEKKHGTRIVAQRIMFLEG